MSTNNHLPTWYKLFIERRIKKLETALGFLDNAELSLKYGFFITSKAFLDNAKKYLKQ